MYNTVKFVLEREQYQHFPIDHQSKSMEELKTILLSTQITALSNTTKEDSTDIYYFLSVESMKPLRITDF